MTSNAPLPDPRNSHKLLYNIPELRAALGGISRDTVYRLFKEGHLKKLKIGASTYVQVDEVKAYVDRLAA